ncbi:hypothetical protein FRC09_009534 [Ceratobasidium sp. 395]|nr:hypothetical protein FRC09_009534 [Ceratobasidium sp. 395]
MSEAHDNHVLGGYKATLSLVFCSLFHCATTNAPKSNPNAGPEAKANAERILAEAGETVTGTTHTTGTTGGDEHDNRVLGGYKATLSNPNVGPEAKAHAEQMLADAGVSAGSTTDTSRDQHEKNVLAGYKGVLSNDNTSAEAKEKATEILRAAGEL